MNTKNCFVPRCNNDSYSSSKIFVSVPRNLERRKLWWAAVGHMDILQATAKLFCCEDHFEIPDDFENWSFFKLMDTPLRIKKWVVPHKCIQSSCYSPHKSQLTDSAKKRKVENMKISSKKLAGKENQPSTSGVSRQLFNKNTPDLQEAAEISDSCPLQEIQNEPTLNLEVYNLKTLLQEYPESPDSFEDSEFMPESEETSSSISDSSEGLNNNDQDLQKQLTIKIIEKQPKVYLGLPNSVFKILNDICEKESVAYIDLLITLRKIKLDESYVILSTCFGTSVSYIQRAFTGSIDKIANYFNNFIFWPTLQQVQMNLPISFRARYGKICSIIDCFEIEIEKPSNPVIQASTWSNYKQCNTAKFLISCTPSGFINFISSSFPGRISDKEIIEKCGYLNKVIPGSHIMADRGFKNIQPLLENMGCTLVRPPSVSQNEKSSPEDVQLSKRIASLRIHVERIIRRVREFHMLKPHSCVNFKQVHLLSNICIIACGIVNLQEPIL